MIFDDATHFFWRACTKKQFQKQRCGHNDWPNESHRPCGRGFEVMSGGTLLQASVGHGRGRWVSFWGVGVAVLSLR